MASVLRPVNGSATKTIGPNGVKRDYAAGFAFVGRNITLPLDVTAQADWLRDQVRQDEFTIGGDIRDGAADMKTIINRRYLDRGDGIKPDILDVPQFVFFADCDGVTGVCDFRQDPSGAAASVRDLIPELRGAACAFVGSSQAGRSELVRGKFLFVLSAPKSMPELRAWAEDANRRAGLKIIDPALYNPVQPVYLATPWFVDGAVDPMPVRVLVLPGEERSVVLPEPDSYPGNARPCAKRRTVPLCRVNDCQVTELGVRARPACRSCSPACKAMNDDLGAGVSDFDFAEFKDAVEHLTGRGWFGEGEHDHMLALAFACALIEIKDKRLRMTCAPSTTRSSTRPGATGATMSSVCRRPERARRGSCATAKSSPPARSSTGRTSGVGRCAGHIPRPRGCDRAGDRKGQGDRRLQAGTSRVTGPRAVSPREILRRRRRRRYQA